MLGENYYANAVLTLVDQRTAKVAKTSSLPTTILPTTFILILLNQRFPKVPQLLRYYILAYQH